MLTKMLVRIRLTMCAAMLTANVISGIASKAVSNFEMTVSASVIGSERQNSMLLFLRSAYSVSRQ